VPCAWQKDSLDFQKSQPALCKYVRQAHQTRQAMRVEWSSRRAAAIDTAVPQLAQSNPASEALNDRKPYQHGWPPSEISEASLRLSP
jgi:hypothetical protein